MDDISQLQNIIEREVVTNCDNFRSGRDLTAKILIKGRLCFEAISDVTIDSDKQFLVGYLKDVIKRHFGGEDGFENGGGI